MKNRTIHFIGVTSMVAFPFNLFAQQTANTNVIVIIADDIGYGDLSCYGEKTIQTPNVERLAKDGVRFTDAHAVAAASTPSRYSFLTGQYAWRRTDTGIATGDAGMIIRPEQYTVADLFKDAGYKTGAIGKWHLGIGDKTGTQDWNGQITPGLKDIGFDYSYIMAATGDRVPCVWVENHEVVGLDSNDPIEVSYKKPFPGEPFKALVSQVDFLASMAAFLNKPLPENLHTDSRNQFAVWCGKDKSGRDYVVEVASGLAISDGQWKYIVPNKGAPYNKWTNTELGNNPEPQLYHLKEDRG